jgi:ribosome-associated heat shock protein Hsp15
MVKQVQSAPLGELRLDKWLWAARFFKTRSAAVTAINGGKVHLNDARVKPAKVVRVGDRLRVRRGDQEQVVEVLGLNDKRRPATEAQGLYAETPESVAAREARADQRRLEAQAAGYASDGRPNKKQRRQIHRFRDAFDD